MAAVSGPIVYDADRAGPEVVTATHAHRILQGARPADLQLVASLSEEAHELWLREFHRLLRPGGLLLATTWPREYIIRCERARQGDTLGTHPGSLGAFQGTADWLARYDRGEFCHSPVGGEDALSSSFYGESCIPQPYVEARWSRSFRALDYVEADGRRLWQNLIVARR